MSYNFGVGSVLSGIGLAGYGGYRYITANQMPAREANRQKVMATRCVVAGLAAITMGVGLVYMGTEQRDVVTIGTGTDQEFDPISCPIPTLREILTKGGSDSMTARAFKVLDENDGVSCKNFLLWRRGFSHGDYIDNIGQGDVHKSAVWGIEPGWAQCPHITLQYVCNQTKEGVATLSEGVATLFQRYTNKGDPFVLAGHHQVRGCKLDDFLGQPCDAYTFGTPKEDFLNKLSLFLKGNPLFNGVTSVTRKIG